MCCLLTVLVFIGPRAGILVSWLIDPVRWQLAYDNVVVPVLGFLVVPWTTLVYVYVAPAGVTGFDWVWLGIAILVDLSSYASGAWGNRGRRRSY